MIEIPRGSRNKYEVDHASGLIRLDLRPDNEQRDEPGQEPDGHHP